MGAEQDRIHDEAAKATALKIDKEITGRSSPLVEARHKCCYCGREATLDSGNDEIRCTASRKHDGYHCSCFEEEIDRLCEELTNRLDEQVKRRRDKDLAAREAAHRAVLAATIATDPSEKHWISPRTVQEVQAGRQFLVDRGGGGCRAQWLIWLVDTVSGTITLDVDRPMLAAEIREVFSDCKAPLSPTLSADQVDALVARMVDRLVGPEEPEEPEEDGEEAGDQPEEQARQQQQQQEKQA